MKKFIINILSFLLLLTIIAYISISLPPTPRLLTSPIYGKIKKDSLLNHTKGPRIVFLGGSNLPFGLNSKMIKDSLNLNPVNAGIMHTIGLKKILDNYLNYVKTNDVVIISPEYQHFFGDFMNGHESTLYYNSIGNRNPFQGLDYDQFSNLVPYLPKYVFKKLDPREYYGYSVSKFFNSQSYNQFGDIQAHWTLESISFSSNNGINDKFNQDIIEYLLYFQDIISKKNARLYISPPPFNENSAKNNTNQIQLVERCLKNVGFKTLGEFEKYIFHDTLFFNSSYHLTKDGAMIRTQMFVEDYKARTHNNVYKK